MDTKQTPISVLNPEQVRLLAIFMEQDFDLCNFAKAATIQLAQALAFIGNQAILDAIDFIKEFELSRLAHNAAKARASTVLLLNRFIHRHDSCDPDHLSENAPVSPHARLVTSAANTLARLSDLKSNTKNAPRTPQNPTTPTPTNTPLTPPPSPDFPFSPDSPSQSDPLSLDETADALEELTKLQAWATAAATHLRTLAQQDHESIQLQTMSPSNTPTNDPR